ncbi:MAG: DUF4381 family protein [Pseudomonadota bacterium]
MNESLPLRDVHAALTPPWWPPAPGWWVVAVLSLLALGLLAWRGWHGWQRHRRRQRLLAELALAIGAESDLDYLRAVADFCKRLLLHEGGRQDLAVASGEGFADALAEPWSEDDRYRDAARALALDQYRPATTVVREPVTALAQAWIERIVRGEVR